jgi:5-methylcytosine-specific restriction enzyme subunit McrC
MHPDIVLTDKQTKKTLIIDTKYYTNVMGSRIEGAKKKVSSDNLYQIFTYVKNWKIKDGETVSGMLLYAKTMEKVLPNATYKMSGNEMHVRTLDLGRDFVDIKSELDSIAELVKS